MSILSKIKKEFSAEQAAKAAEKAKKQHAKEVLQRIEQEEYEKAKTERDV